MLIVTKLANKSLSRNIGRVIDLRRLVCIGDSLEHGIEGAIRSFFDSHWITNGVHTSEINELRSSISSNPAPMIEGSDESFEAFHPIDIVRLNTDLTIPDIQRLIQKHYQQVEMRFDGWKGKKSKRVLSFLCIEVLILIHFLTIPYTFSITLAI